jgi:hypothetical protein
MVDIRLVDRVDIYHVDLVDVKHCVWRKWTLWIDGRSTWTMWTLWRN